MTLSVIVQARMTSKRFPGKVTAPLLGRPVLEHVLERALKIPVAHKTICAFPEDEASAPILDLCRKMRVIAFAGPEHDVLGRYYEAAKSAGTEWIMRVTADCPLLDPALCARVYAVTKIEDADYGSNVHPERTYPRGLDCEVFTFTCLEAAHMSVDDAYGREHVTPWMQTTDGLNVVNIKSNKDWSKLNYCVDYPDDIVRIEKIIESAHDKQR